MCDGLKAEEKQSVDINSALKCRKLKHGRQRLSFKETVEISGANVVASL